MTPLGSVVMLVLLGSTQSGSTGAGEIPESGTCRGGRELDFSPVNQLNKPEEVELEATAVEVAYLLVLRPPTRSYQVEMTAEIYSLRKNEHIAQKAYCYRLKPWLVQGMMQIAKHIISKEKTRI